MASPHSLHRSVTSEFSAPHFPQYNSPPRPRLRLTHYQAARDHIVQRLLLFGESSHDVSDQKRKTRNELGEVTTGGTCKRNSIAFKIRDVESQRLFTKCCLPAGALHE